MRTKQNTRKNSIQSHAKRIANQLAIYLHKSPFYKLSLMEKMASFDSGPVAV